MKKVLVLLSIILTSLLVFLTINKTYAATNDSFVYPIRNLVDENKTSYFKVVINIDDNTTNTYYAEFLKAKNDFVNGESGTIMTVTKDDALQALYKITESQEMNNRDSSLYKNIKIELKSNKPVTLTQKFPIGIYKNTWLKLDNTITIDATNTSPMLTNTKDRNTQPYKNSAYKPYSYNSNIVIEGGIWNSNRGNNKVASQGFTLGNASNIYIRNVTIKDVAGGHAIDVAGVNGLVIENSNFLGVALIGGNSDRDYNEAIQLDHMATSGPFTSTASSWGYFDGSVTKNVYIANNTFGASKSPNTQPWYVGIGSHSVVKNVPFENIIIYKNKFSSMAKAGIRMTNYKNVLVSSNTFENSDHGIKIYSSNYAFDYSKKVVNNNVKYPSVNDTITIQSNTFNKIKVWGVQINSAGYGGVTNGITKNVILKNNKYLNFSATKIFHQDYGQNTKILDAYHYHINGYVIAEKDAIAHVNDLKRRGFDASYKKVFKDQLYRVGITKRFNSKSSANAAANLIKKNTGINAYVKAESKKKYYVYTDYILGSAKAKQVETIIEKKMKTKYAANTYNANHKNNLYRVGISTRFNSYAAAKKASDDFYKLTKATAVINKEKSGKYYVRTNNLVGKTRANNIAKTMKKKGYKSFAYNTNQMVYYEITVHPFNSKTTANNQAASFKNKYKWIDAVSVNTKD